MILKGLKVEIAGVFATIMTGAVCGAFAGPFYGADGWKITIFSQANISGNTLDSYQV